MCVMGIFSDSLIIPAISANDNQMRSNCSLVYENDNRQEPYQTIATIETIIDIGAWEWSRIKQNKLYLMLFVNK